MRIISGRLKSLQIKTLSRKKAGGALRPTSNYSKQLIFNLLKSNNIVSREVEGAVVMDGFAGTGAVGMEFFSRGASHITFVECEPLNIKQLKGQTSELGISCDIIRTFLPDTTKIKSKFDIIFLDPPYTDGKGKIVQTVKNLLNHLSEDGIIILETVTGKKNKEEMQKHLQKKGVISKLIYEKEASSKTCFLFFKNNTDAKTLTLEPGN